MRTVGWDLPNTTCALVRRDQDADTHRESPVKARGEEPSTSQGETPREDPDQGPQASELRNFWELKVLCSCCYGR